MLMTESGNRNFQQQSNYTGHHFHLQSKFEEKFRSYLLTAAGVGVATPRQIKYRLQFTVEIGRKPSKEIQNKFVSSLMKSQKLHFSVSNSSYNREFSADHFDMAEKRNLIGLPENASLVATY